MYKLLRTVLPLNFSRRCSNVTQFRNLSANKLNASEEEQLVKSEVGGNRRTVEHTTNETDIDIATALFDNSSLEHRPQSLRKKEWRATDPFNVTKARTTNRKSKVTVVKTSPAKVHFHPDLGLEVVRFESQQDPVLTALLMKVRSRKRRDKVGEILVEGRRLIRDALDCGLNLKAIIFSQAEQVKKLQDEVSQPERIAAAKIYKVAHHDIKIWSTLTTPPGMMAIFDRPGHATSDRTAINSTPMPITVVCDNIREPNNLGSILRTCAAIPCSRVIITRGCCDPWDTKALRGGCGGQFRVQIHDDIDWEHLPQHIPSDIFSSDNCGVFIAENNVARMQKGTETIQYTDLECAPGGHSVVIVGGESHGVSEEAYKFLEMFGNKGKCLHIPLAHGVDSLNVASALTLILYEMRNHIQRKDASATPCVDQ